MQHMVFPFCASPWAAHWSPALFLLSFRFSLGVNHSTKPSLTDFTDFGFSILHLCPPLHCDGLLYLSVPRAELRTWTIAGTQFMLVEPHWLRAGNIFVVFLLGLPSWWITSFLNSILLFESH